MNISEYKYRDELAESLNNSILGQQFKYSSYKGRQFYHIPERVEQVVETRQKLEWLKWELYHLILFGCMPLEEDEQFSFK